MSDAGKYAVLIFALVPLIGIAVIYIRERAERHVEDLCMLIARYPSSTAAELGAHFRGGDRVERYAQPLIRERFVDCYEGLDGRPRYRLTPKGVVALRGLEKMDRRT